MCFNRDHETSLLFYTFLYLDCALNPCIYYSQYLMQIVKMLIRERQGTAEPLTRAAFLNSTVSIQFRKICFHFPDEPFKKTTQLNYIQQSHDISPVTKGQILQISICMRSPSNCASFSIERNMHVILGFAEFGLQLITWQNRASTKFAVSSKTS